MLGQIVYLNEQHGMFAVQLESGLFTICEHLDTCDLQKGQQVKGPFDSVGSETIYNIDLQEPVEVCIQWSELNRRDAQKALSRFS